MALPTKADAVEIAELCREYLEAHERRNPDHEVMTLAEQMTSAVLFHEIRRLVGEAVSPTIGTAA